MASQNASARDKCGSTRKIPGASSPRATTAPHGKRRTMIYPVRLPPVAVMSIRVKRQPNSPVRYALPDFETSYPVKVGKCGAAPDS